MNNYLTNQQLKDLDSLFDLVSDRQLQDFGNISASNKSDGSLITSCDLWSDKTIVEAPVSYTHLTLPTILRV